MTEKTAETKATHALFAGATPKAKRFVAQGTKAEMEKLQEEHTRAYRTTKAGLFTEIVKL